jgi:hypothetical protein
MPANINWTGSILAGHDENFAIGIRGTHYE